MLRLIVVLLAVGCYIASTAVVVTAMSSSPLWQQVILALIPSAIAFVGSWLIRGWEPAQLVTHHLLGIITDRRSRWGLTITYEVSDGKTALEKAKTVILAKTDSRLWQDDKTQKVFESRSSYALRVYQVPSLTAGESGEQLDSIVVHFSNMLIPYRDSVALLRNELYPLFNALERELGPKFQKYDMTISLDPKKNPFYGFFVKEVPLALMNDFSLRLQVPRLAAKHSIRVSKDQIAVSTRDPFLLQQLALHYLTFSSSPLPSASRSSA